MKPSESEEWMCAINRGGLICINDSFYYTLCAIEYSTWYHFNIIGIDINNIVENVLNDHLP